MNLRALSHQELTTLYSYRLMEAHRRRHEIELLGATPDTQDWWRDDPIVADYFTIELPAIKAEMQRRGLIASEAAVH